VDDGGGVATDWNRSGSIHGSFTGTGYTLSNMVIVRATTDYIGLFGSVTTGSLTGIKMTGGSVSGQGAVGFLAGKTVVTVISCSTTGTVAGTGASIGGLWVHIQGL